MAENEPIEVDAFYRYGYRDRDMMAIRAPFAMGSDADIIGKRLRAGDAVFCVANVSRQISGPIQKGEPIGVEIIETSRRG